MQIVYFPEELHARAPSAVGVLCIAPSNRWVTFYDVINIVGAGEAVTIRHATEKEIERAEKRVVLHEISVQLGAHIGSVLDQEPPEVAAHFCANLKEAIESTPSPSLPDLVQQDDVAETPAPQGNPFDDLPQLYAALRCAHLAGNHDDVAQLDAGIQSILRAPAAVGERIEIQ